MFSSLPRKHRICFRGNGRGNSRHHSIGASCCWFHHSPNPQLTIGDFLSLLSIQIHACAVKSFMGLRLQFLPPHLFPFCSALWNFDSIPSASSIFIIEEYGTSCCPAYALILFKSVVETRKLILSSGLQEAIRCQYPLISSFFFDQYRM